MIARLSIRIKFLHKTIIFLYSRLQFCNIFEMQTLDNKEVAKSKRLNSRNA